jgi:glycosyltransferase involved in cell wall biosynthesis
MRVAMLMAAAGSRVGGLETIAREFAAALAARGHTVTLVTGVGPGARLHRDLRDGQAPYRVRTVPMLGQGSWPARLLGRMRGVHPSIVEARTFWAVARRRPAIRRELQGSQVVAAFFEVEAVAASRELAVPVVYYYPGAIDARRLARGRFARMIAISHMVADHYTGMRAGMDLPPIDGVVPPGIRAEWIAAGPAPGVTADPPEAIFSGRLDWPGPKRAEKLVEWWPQVQAAVPGARLTLIGDGTQRAALQQAVADAGLTDVVYLPGASPHDALLARLRTASLYVFPSQFETFGIAPLEALAAGLPVLASDIPALRESLGEAAWLLPVDDAAWVAALIRLLGDPALRREWAAKGPAHARGFTWDAQAAAYEAHLLAAAGLESGDSAARTARRSAHQV